MRAGTERHAHRASAGDRRNAVKNRHPCDEKREGRVEHVGEALVAEDERADERLCLGAHRGPQVLVEGRKERAVGRRPVEGVEKPVSGEVVDQRLSLGVGEHAAHLTGEYAFVRELAGIRERKSASSGMELHRKYERRLASS